MKTQQEKETENRRIGIAVTLGFHAVLLLVFFFMVAWQLPLPLPSGVPGSSINIGFTDAGYGDEQTNIEQPVETPVEEIVEEEKVEEEAPVKEEKILTGTEEAPYSVKENEKVKEEKKEQKPEKVETKNLFPTKTNSISDGNQPNKKGDQGNPEGNPDTRNMYPGNGTGGIGPGPGGNGASMNMAGWEWDSRPDKIDPTSESGYVIFEFYVDQDGVVINATKIGGANFTPSEDNFYKNQLMNTTFSQKDTRVKPASRTKGVFRFDVRSR